MSATSVTLRGRIAAEALMVDACVVTRLASQVTDPETGVVTPTYSTIYTGKCKVQRSQRASRVAPTSVGEAEVFESRLELHLPTSATGVTSDDIATITASALDAGLVGVQFHVREPSEKTFTTAHRFGIIQVTS